MRVCDGWVLVPSRVPRWPEKPEESAGVHLLATYPQLTYPRGFWGLESVGSLESVAPLALATEGSKGASGVGFLNPPVGSLNLGHLGL